MKSTRWGLAAVVAVAAFAVVVEEEASRIHLEEEEEEALLVVEEGEVQRPWPACCRQRVLQSSRGRLGVESRFPCWPVRAEEEAAEIVE